MNLLAVCGNGMGTSTIIKIKINQICKELGIKVNVDSCSAGESKSFLAKTDILVTTPEWAKIMQIPENVITISMTNLMDTVGLRKELERAIEEYNNRK